MKMLSQTKIWFLLVTLAVVLTRTHAVRFSEAQLVFHQSILEFFWPSEADKEEAIRNGSYMPERNTLIGIKIYKNDVYVNVARLFFTSGNPVTLAKLVKVHGQYKLRPYPNWPAQKLGDCRAFQYVMSMEIDPNTGLMYAIDTGRIGDVLNLCPAKIVVFEVNSDQQVGSYEFPDDVVSRNRTLLNDIVLDYVDGKARYAYISGTREGRIHVFYFQTRTADSLEHPSMKLGGKNESVIHINGKDYVFDTAIDGIAMSPDFKCVYYSRLGSYNMYQVPTSVLRDPNYSGCEGLRSVGRKISQGNGMGNGSKHLFYGVRSRNAVYYWDVDKDMADQNVGIDKVKLASEVELAWNGTEMAWPDSFAFDNQGWIWFIAISLHTFVYEGKPLNHIWKVYVSETSCLYEADRRTARPCAG